MEWNGQCVATTYFFSFLFRIQTNHLLISRVSTKKQQLIGPEKVILKVSPEPCITAYIFPLTEYVPKAKT